jgi:hypothetical protein
MEEAPLFGCRLISGSYSHPSPVSPHRQAVPATQREESPSWRKKEGKEGGRERSYIQQQKKNGPLPIYLNFTKQTLFVQITP